MTKPRTPTKPATMLIRTLSRYPDALCGTHTTHIMTPWQRSDWRGEFERQIERTLAVDPAATITWEV